MVFVTNEPKKIDQSTDTPMYVVRYYIVRTRRRFIIVRFLGDFIATNLQALVLTDFYFLYILYIQEGILFDLFRWIDCRLMNIVRCIW